MSTVTPQQSLDLLTPEVEKLSAEIAALTPSQWETTSNCEGWKVADLAAHVVRNGESILLAIQRALSGDETPSFGPTMKPREDQMRASGPAGCADLQRREHRELVELVGGLSPEQLLKAGKHPSGPRSIAWFCTQRLVEVAVHHWDLRKSLGGGGPLGATLAAYVLPFMLDGQLPSIAVRRSEGAEGHFYLVANGDSWLATVADGRLTVVPGGTPNGAIKIEGGPGWLVLALYGRMGIDGPEFKVTGPADAAAIFRRAFGGS